MIRATTDHAPAPALPLSLLFAAVSRRLHGAAVGADALLLSRWIDESVAGRRCSSIAVLRAAAGATTCAARSRRCSSLFRALARHASPVIATAISASACRWARQRRTRRPGRRAQRARRRVARAAPVAGAARAAARHDGAEHAGGDAAGRSAPARSSTRNLAARKLLNDGRKLEGLRFDALLEQTPRRRCAKRSSAAATACSPSATTRTRKRSTTSRGATSGSTAAAHELFLLRQLTAELRRQEVQTWKKVIRVISHELNNSLAPIASLAHSGAELLRRGQLRAACRNAFATIEERARHLEGFIRGYARFAKLPAPTLRSRSPGRAFLAQLRSAGAISSPTADRPTHAARFDAAQTRAGADQPAQERARIRLGGRAKSRLRVRRIAGRLAHRRAATAAAA